MNETIGTNDEQQGNICEDLIYLLRCAIHQKVPDPERVDRMDPEAVYELADRHMVAATAGMALESAGKQTEKFAKAVAKAQRKNALLDADRGAIFKELEKAGIWYMPLKGSLLKDLYPRYGMRQMVDNDILFDASRAADVKKIMVSMGFTVKQFDRSAHDVYLKKPVSSFEMHRSLFNRDSMKNLDDYYKNVKKERLIPNGAGEYGYHFSDDDFYIYLVAHEYKHFSRGGSGIRSLMDIYVYLTHKHVDPDYVARETEKMDIREFEEKNRNLAMRVFSGEELTEADREMLDFMLDAGTYGKNVNRVVRMIREKGHGGYVRTRLFLPMITMKRIYPIMRKAPWLYPVFAVWRLISRFFTSHSKYVLEAKAALGLNREVKEKQKKQK